MENGFRIQPEAFYDIDTVCESLNVKRSSLDKERQAGRLHSTRKAGQFLFRGQWIIDWLESTATQRQTRVPESANV